MVRFNIGVISGCLALVALPQSGMAADYDTSDVLRGSYDWTTPEEDSIGFEFGLRYLYSKGGQSHSISGEPETSNDTSHILELHGRIDDYSTNYFLRGTAAYGISTEGDYSGDWQNFGNGQVSDGVVSYIGGDLGQYWFGSPRDGFGVGAFVGYQYLNDNPDIGRANFTTAASASDITWSTTSTEWRVPMDSAQNNLQVHMLRLGGTARAELNDSLDFSLDVAAIPYANISGTMGAFGIANIAQSATTTWVQSSAAEVDGWGYGAAAEAAFGFRPAKNMLIRLGGRARYLQGTYDSTFYGATITEQADADNDGTYETAPIFTNQRYISTDNPFKMWRIGGFLELTGKF